MTSWSDWDRPKPKYAPTFSCEYICQSSWKNWVACSTWFLLCALLMAAIPSNHLVNSTKVPMAISSRSISLGLFTAKPPALESKVEGQKVESRRQQRLSTFDFQLSTRNDERSESFLGLLFMLLRGLRFFSRLGFRSFRFGFGRFNRSSG